MCPGLRWRLGTEINQTRSPPCDILWLAGELEYEHKHFQPRVLRAVEKQARKSRCLEGALTAESPPPKDERLGQGRGGRAQGGTRHTARADSGKTLKRGFTFSSQVTSGH